MQIAGSTAVCKEIIRIADQLYSSMYYNAQPIIQRHVAHQEDADTYTNHDTNDHDDGNGNGHSHEHDHPRAIAQRQRDAEKWSAYESALGQWRCQQFAFETELQAFFGYMGMESNFYRRYVQDLNPLHRSWKWRIRIKTIVLKINYEKKGRNSIIPATKLQLLPLVRMMGMR